MIMKRNERRADLGLNAREWKTGKITYDPVEGM